MFKFRQYVYSHQWFVKLMVATDLGICIHVYQVLTSNFSFGGFILSKISYASLKTILHKPIIINI